jgi:UPF0755 protein
VRRFLLLLVVLVLVAGGALFFWFQSEISTPYYGAPQPEVFVEIPRGASSERIARLLEQAGVIHHRLPLRLHLAWTGLSRRLQAGEYRFDRPATPVEVIDRIARGDVFFVGLTVPEGLTAAETVALAAQAGLGSEADLRAAVRRADLVRDLDPAATNLEGYLFPETYRFPRTAGAEQVVKAMVERFRQVYARLGRQSPPAAGWTTRRVVTLASMVEKEAKHDQERGQVASVLVNRLDIGMPLACDPTVIYALKLRGNYDGNIHKADLAIDSPYNTYRFPGLPPGPIANPGEASLRAALRPDHTEFLYFVARNDGTHEFSRNYEAHSRAVARYQLHGSR